MQRLELKKCVIDFAKYKDQDALKKIDGKKVTTLKKMEKLVDAQWAGSRKSKQCTLILTEGDSAKAFALAGLEVIGREKYGIFPLRGKLLNVREAPASKLAKNEEIINIIKIMGLKHGKVYNDTSKLRYGSILLLVDSDVDGSHIKGLLMNFIHYLWPSLLRIEGFIQSMATPIVKTWKSSDKKMKNIINFYTLSEYDNWKKTVNINAWKSKYYKGLGTSTDEEAKMSFVDFDVRKIKYKWTGENVQATNKEEKEDDNSKEESENDSKDEFYEDRTNENYKGFTLAFAKEFANLRKTWLLQYDKNAIIENDHNIVTFRDFIDKELKHFSNYDNVRSIPSINDGLKPSQRKILYGAFKRNLYNEEVKVVQLGGYVSDQAAYHHGEVSLHEAIIKMAQNFVGANNVNLLRPNGNFGNRRQGGNNAASPRYIYTQLSELTPLLFRKEDENIYDYCMDDGNYIEPVTYEPILPMILINGCQGIGTGWSTNIPSFNPKDIIMNIKRLLQNKDCKHMIPWYMGFTGEIKKEDEGSSYVSYGKYEIENENTIIIQELPIGVWTEDYFSFLDSLIADDPKKPAKGQIILQRIDNCGNNTINITVIFAQGELQRMEKKGILIKEMKLQKNINISNMHLHDIKDKIVKYDSVDDILIEYKTNRLIVYGKRKEFNLKFLKHKMDIMKWKIKFLELVINDKFKLFEKNGGKNIPIKDEQWDSQFVEYKFPKFGSSFDTPDEDKSYSYVKDMTVGTLTEEKLEQLRKQRDERIVEYEKYLETPIEDIWISEINEFEKAYDKWLSTLIDDDGDSKKSKKSSKTKKSKK